jgi:hypothetical protein
MKAKLFLVLSIVVMTTMGFECINDPILVTVNADPISGCVTINPGSGTFNSSTGPINIKSLIPSDYQNKFKKLRVYDVEIKVEHPHPNGTVNGSVFVRFDTQPEIQVLNYNVDYEDLSGGISLRNSGGKITYNAAGFASIVAALSGSTLPTSAVIRATGTGPTITQNLVLCTKMFLQVDAQN